MGCLRLFWLFLPSEHPYGMQKQPIFGNFVSIFWLFLHKIGNFVIKNSDFNPFLALAKNLTKWSRPNERKGTKKRKMVNLDCFVPGNDAKRQQLND